MTSVLEQVGFYSPASQLAPFREMLKSHFEHHSSTRITQALADIQQLTGLVDSSGKPCGCSSCFSGSRRWPWTHY